MKVESLRAFFPKFRPVGTRERAGRATRETGLPPVFGKESVKWSGQLLSVPMYLPLDELFSQIGSYPLLKISTGEVELCLLTTF